MTSDDPSTRSHNDQPPYMPPRQSPYFSERQENQQQPPSQQPHVPPSPPLGFEPSDLRPAPPPAEPHRSRSPRRRKANVIVLSVIGVLVVGVGVTAALSGVPKTPAANKQSAPPVVQAPSSPAVSAQDQQFVSDMQAHFSFDSSVSTASIAQFGEGVCSSRQSGESQTQQVTNTQKEWTNTDPGTADEMVRLAEQDICPSYLPGYTVTYVVTGNAPAGYIDPSIDYGPAGSDFTGSVPMNVSDPIPASPPSYYSISVQLSDAGGSVTCELQVDGVTISQSSAQGADQIATCEIGQDPITGAWEDDNSG